MRWSEIHEGLIRLRELRDELRERWLADDCSPDMLPPDVFAFATKVAEAIPPSLARTYLAEQARVYGAILTLMLPWGRMVGSRFPTPGEREKHGATLVVYFNGEVDNG
ncbi:MAG: hypothetical protein GTN71_05770 [Anaerolineae bacterium]|nr:hypothetical protein [Anaerolineae bacterium]